MILYVIVPSKPVLVFPVAHKSSMTTWDDDLCYEQIEGKKPSCCGQHCVERP